MASSQTKLGKLGVGTADPIDKLLRFVEFDPGVTREQRVARGTAGTFYNDANLLRESRVLVTPTLQAEPTSVELAILLAWALGPASGTTYVPQVAVASRNIHWKPVAGEEFFLPNVGCDNFTLSASVGEPLSVSMDLVGTTYDDTRSDFPGSPTLDVSSGPFMLADCSAVGGAFSYGGTTRQPTGFTLRVSNNIDRNRFLNSLFLTRVQKLDQSFGITFEIPSGDNVSFWDTGSTPAAFVATFENINTGATLTISMPAVMFPSQSPRHPAGAEGMIAIDGQGFRTGGTGHPLTITLDQS